MVMKPEPWGRLSTPALHPTTRSSSPRRGRPLQPGPGHELAGRDHLVFACGRYEGIDQRVLDHAATPDVREV